MLQMPTPKVGLFGTSLILGSKIRKISQLQRAVKNALVDEFKWNLCQIEGLGLIFQDFFEFWIFINFSMFYTYLNMAQIRFFENNWKYPKYVVFESKNMKFGWKISIFVFATFFFVPSSRYSPEGFSLTATAQKLCIYLQIIFSDFSDFPDFPI